MAQTSNLSWEDAIRSVLAQAGGALHYAEIAERIGMRNLRASVGATPSKTVASVISTAMKKGGSPYVRVGGGQYALEQTLSAKVSDAPATPVIDVDSGEAGVLRAFGMFWQRDALVWAGGKQRLLGRQGAGATDVDFGQQIGVYLLHDRERVIYLGGPRTRSSLD